MKITILEAYDGSSEAFVGVAKEWVGRRVVAEGRGRKDRGDGV